MDEARSTLGAPGLLLTSGGLGLLWPARGTWGSLPPPAVAGVLLLTGAGPLAYHLVLVAILGFFSWVCVAFGDWGEARWGRKDAGQIVADETAGMCIPLLLPPAVVLDHVGSTTVDGFLWLCGYLGAAFLLFRFFDIVKVPPAYQVQRMRGGIGVLTDDLIAGVYAAVVLQVGVWAIL